MRGFFIFVIVAALISFGGCDRDEDSTDDDGREAGPVCSEEAVDEVWQAHGEYFGAETAFQAVHALLNVCEGLGSDFEVLEEALVNAHPADRHLEISHMVAKRMDLWEQVCPAGSKAFEKLETASPEERFMILWETCEFEERLPVVEDELVVNPPPAAANLFLLVVGADGGAVAPKGPLANFARLIFASEMPNTPFADGDGSPSTAEEGDLPEALGGVALAAQQDWHDDSWPARFGSLGGVVLPRTDDEDGGVKRIEFCPFSPLDDVERLVAHLDAAFGDQVERLDVDEPGVERTYRQDDRSVTVIYDGHRAGSEFDVCMWVE